VTALVLDAGALVAVDRDDRAMRARLRVAQAQGLELLSLGFIFSERRQLRMTGQGVGELGP
jgi:hypothetical protein